MFGKAPATFTSMLAEPASARLKHHTKVSILYFECFLPTQLLFSTPEEGSVLCCGLPAHSLEIPSGGLAPGLTNWSHPLLKMTIFVGGQAKKSQNKTPLSFHLEWMHHSLTKKKKKDELGGWCRRQRRKHPHVWDRSLTTLPPCGG